MVKSGIFALFWRNTSKVKWVLSSVVQLLYEKWQHVHKRHLFVSYFHLLVAISIFSHLRFFHANDETRRWEISPLDLMLKGSHNTHHRAYLSSLSRSLSLPPSLISFIHSACDSFPFPSSTKRKWAKTRAVKTTEMNRSECWISAK